MKKPEPAWLWQNGDHLLLPNLAQADAWPRLDLKQNELFSYTTLEQRIPNDHPLRPLRELVDAVLVSMYQDFGGLYSALGRASIALERLQRASLLQVIYTIRSGRQLV